MPPLVSVITAAYNAEPFIREAVESVLAQTLTDFELIVIDDASTDATPEILKSYSDKRIRVLRNQRNLKRAAARNVGIAAARGQYVAIHDADDIALPHRLETQVRYLDLHPGVAVLGSYAIGIGEQGNVLRLWDHPPAEDIDIKWTLLHHNPFIHSAVMLRRAVLDHVGNYLESSDAELVEDYELLSRMSRVAACANLTIPLLKYRFHENSASSREIERQRRQSNQVAQQNICCLTGWRTMDLECWDARERFLYHDPHAPIDLNAEQVRSTFGFLEALHEAFYQKHGLERSEWARHRRLHFTRYARHGFSLALRRNGKRESRCRALLFLYAFDMLRKALRPTQGHERRRKQSSIGNQLKGECRPES